VVFPDFDPAAAIASGADVVLVDELAHATPDRSRQRWEDVADVLAAGPDVVTTANIAHLRSVREFAADLRVVHVEIGDGLARPGQDLTGHHELTGELGGIYTNVPGHAVAQALADAAKAQGASTVVVGRHRSRLAEFIHGSVSSRLRRLLPAMEIEEVSHP